MKVLVALASANRRGAEIEGTELARQLSARGVEAEVVALAPSSGAVSLDVEVLGAAPLSTATLRALRRRATGFDVVIAYGSSSLPACAIALLGSRVPFVYRSIGDPTQWSRGGLHRLRTVLLFHRAKRVVALWPEAGEAIGRLYRVPAKRIVVIPNARDEAVFRPPSDAERAEARAAFGSTDDATVVAFVGALSAEKRPLLAIESVMQVDGAHLLIAGDGPLRGEVEAAASDSGGRVHVLGSLPDVRPVLWASDVLVNTSSTEGMPGSLIEASMCGVPVVTTDVGAVCEVVGATSSVVEPSASAETIAAAVRDVADGPGTSAADAQRFSWGAVAPQWLGALGDAAR
ncbi:MAG: glycosyltransferase family 4 protein [Actinomycetes bacterium]